MVAEQVSADPVERKTLLAVDDSEEVLCLLREILEGDGYRVLVCPDAGRAYGMVRATKPDLLILDLKLPGLPDGQLLDQVGSDPELTATPMLVCSAAVQEVERRLPELRERGGDAVIKPFDLLDLLEKVDRLTS